MITRDGVGRLVVSGVVLVATVVACGRTPNDVADQRRSPAPAGSSSTIAAAAAGPCDGRPVVETRADAELTTFTSDGEVEVFAETDRAFRRLMDLGIAGPFVGSASQGDGVAWLLNAQGQLVRADVAARQTSVATVDAPGPAISPSNVALTGLSDGVAITQAGTTTVVASSSMTATTIAAPELAAGRTLVLGGSTTDLWAVAAGGRGPLVHVVDGQVARSITIARRGPNDRAAVDGGCVWMLSSNDQPCAPQLQAFDGQSDAPVHAVDIRDGCLAEVTVHDGVVWVAGSGGNVMRYDPRVGHQLSRERVFGCGSDAHVSAGATGVVVADDCDVAAVVLDPATGKVAVRKDLTDLVSDPADAVFELSWPWLLEGTSAHLLRGDLDVIADLAPLGQHPVVLVV